MKRFPLSFLIGILPFLCDSQIVIGTVDSLVMEGIKWHELERYSEAILNFKKALILDPANSKAACELAFTCFTVKDYDNAIHYARQSLFNGNQKLPEGYIVWGS